ncbi:hypothetical protein HDR58_05505 [bacterium]|nr:hypothetical protein [bacterium]
MNKDRIPNKVAANQFGKEVKEMQNEQLLDERWYEAYEDADNDADTFLDTYFGATGFLKRIGNASLTAAEVIAGVQASTAETFSWRKATPPAGLTPLQLAYIIMNGHDVALMPLEYMRYHAPRSCCYVFIYQSDGPDRGIYRTVLEDVIHIYEPDCPEHKMEKVASWLRDIAKMAKLCTKEHLVPLNNGIFNCRTKKLMPFSPKYMFIGKSPLDYVPHPVNPVIHNPDDGTDWDAESWLSGLSDDPETMDGLWEVLDVALRPNKWYAIQNPLLSLMSNLAAKSDSKLDLATLSQLVTGLSGWSRFGECHPNSYLDRKEVLEYILWRVLNRDS